MKTRLFFTMVIAFVITSHLSAQTPKFNVVASYTIPGKASGLAFDGSYLYSGIYGSGGDAVYRIDTSDGSYSFFCSGPMDDAYGMTYDGQYFWTTDHPGAYDPAIARQFDASGTQMDTFELPATYISGIEYDNGDFWVAAYYNPDGEIYKVDTAGNIYTQFASPFAQPWDLCLENEFLWIADYWNNTIDKVDTSGNLLENQPSLGDRPAGIVFDGQYLWYVAGPLNDSSTLYKVDLGIAPLAYIYFPVVDHDFGDVILGDSVMWNAKVKNTGLADLIIDSIIFQLPASPVYSSTAFPMTIVPGDSSVIEFVFKPAASGIVSETATVFSNSSGALPILNFAGNGTTVGIENLNIINDFSIYPNPFSDNTEIYFNISKPQHVTVRIYNLLGEMVAELKNENMGNGECKILWNACNDNGDKITSGIYYCVIRGRDILLNKKLILN